MSNPQHVAVLASVGCVTPSVARRPRVGVVTTGTELVEAAASPGPGQIRDSNGPQLRAQLLEAGAAPRRCRSHEIYCATPMPVPACSLCDARSRRIVII